MDIYNPEDGSSFSNTHIVRVPHYHVKVYPHLKAKTVNTEVIYTLEVKSKTNTIIFDNIKLNIESIKFGEEDCKFSVGNDGPLGAPLTVELPSEL